MSRTLQTLGLIGALSLAGCGADQPKTTRGEYGVYSVTLKRYDDSTHISLYDEKSGELVNAWDTDNDGNANHIFLRWKVEGQRAELDTVEKAYDSVRESIRLEGLNIGGSKLKEERE